MPVWNPFAMMAEAFVVDGPAGADDAGKASQLEGAGKVDCLVKEFQRGVDSRLAGGQVGQARAGQIKRGEAGHGQRGGGVVMQQQMVG